MPHCYSDRARCIVYVLDDGVDGAAVNYADSCLYILPRTVLAFEMAMYVDKLRRYVVCRSRMDIHGLRRHAPSCGHMPCMMYLARRQAAVSSHGRLSVCGHLQSGAPQGPCFHSRTSFAHGSRLGDEEPYSQRQDAIVFKKVQQTPLLVEASLPLFARLVPHA